MDLSVRTKRPESLVQVPLTATQTLPGPVRLAEVGQAAVLGPSLPGSEAVRADHDATGGAGVVQVEQGCAAHVTHLSHTLVSSPPDYLAAAARVVLLHTLLIVE